MSRLPELIRTRCHFCGNFSVAVFLALSQEDNPSFFPPLVFLTNETALHSHETSRFALLKNKIELLTVNQSMAASNNSFCHLLIRHVLS